MLSVVIRLDPSASIVILALIIYKCQYLSYSAEYQKINAELRLKKG